MAEVTYLHVAARDKNDEFYTQLCDVEAELRHHRDELKGKRVLCPFDDPDKSAFSQHLGRLFDVYDLRELVTTCYRSTDLVEFSEGREAHGALTRRIRGKKQTARNLRGDGDFFSEEVQELLKACDVVISNPPFSLFNDIVKAVLREGKKFLFIGRNTKMATNLIFPLWAKGEVGYGPSSPSSGGLHFKIGRDFDAHTVKTKETAKGDRIASVSGTRWITNLSARRVVDSPIYHHEYSPEKYPKYDNCDAIEVSKFRHIPADYKGAMGVPFSIFDYFEPDKFEVVGDTIVRPKLNGKSLFQRVLIRRKA